MKFEQLPLTIISPLTNRTLYKQDWNGRNTLPSISNELWKDQALAAYIGDGELETLDEEVIYIPYEI